MNEKVSVIIPCYNCENFVSEAIESALQQTYKNMEIVIVNDGSTDKSSEIIKHYADKYKNILFFDNKENRGVIYSRNMAIEASTGKYILPLDADDLIAPTYVEKAVNIIENNPDIGMVYCNGMIFGNKNEPLVLPDFSNQNILFGNCIFITSLFRKSDFFRCGKFKEDMSSGCEDWDFWLSFVEMGLQPYKIDETLFYYRNYTGVSRSTFAVKSYEWRKSILKRHIDLYCKNEKFLNIVFSDLEEQLKYTTLKHKKYKKLFNIFLPIIILETIVILVILILIRGL